MKVAIMQPYFFPYIGYYHLLSAVDAFVIYDDIKYTKKGWINRNRILVNGSDVIFSIPLKKGSDSLAIAERELSPDFDRVKLLRQLEGAYIKAPHFKEVYPLIEKIILNKEDNLFKFIYNSISLTCNYLGIGTKILISSEINIDKNLKATDRVIAICKALKGDTYINAIGGVSLYSKEEFKSYGLELNFIKSNSIVYKQVDNDFIPWLSIVDVLMFNALDLIRSRLIYNYELI